MNLSAGLVNNAIHFSGNGQAMFDRLKKAFAKQTVSEPGMPVAAADSRSLGADKGPASVWAASRGLNLQERGQGKGVAIEGDVMGKPWRIEIGKPSRNFIRTEELRARAELGIDEDLGMLIMNRPLKLALEKQAYERYTDTLQTQVDASMPEEVRWLSVYDEVGWDGLPGAFWDRYSVLADERANAQAWLDTPLATMLMNWPVPGPNAQTPFMLILLRSKSYLRMEYQPADVATLEHAAAIFNWSCESALRAFGVNSGANADGKSATKPGIASSGTIGQHSGDASASGFAKL
jgi:hypothetical protein